MKQNVFGLFEHFLKTYCSFKINNYDAFIFLIQFWTNASRVGLQKNKFMITKSIIVTIKNNINHIKFNA